MATLAEASLTVEERQVVERWIDLLRAAIDLDSVWLFGSRARGGQHPQSDIDLLVITRGNPELDRQRVGPTGFGSTFPRHGRQTRTN